MIARFFQAFPPRLSWMVWLVQKRKTKPQRLHHIKAIEVHLKRCWERLQLFLQLEPILLIHNTLKPQEIQSNKLSLCLQQECLLVGKNLKIYHSNSFSKYLLTQVYQLFPFLVHLCFVFYNNLKSLWNLLKL